MFPFETCVPRLWRSFQTRPKPRLPSRLIVLGANEESTQRDKMFSRPFPGRPLPGMCRDICQFGTSSLPPSLSPLSSLVPAVCLSLSYLVSSTVVEVVFAFGRLVHGIRGWNRREVDNPVSLDAISYSILVISVLISALPIGVNCVRGSVRDKLYSLHLGCFSLCL